MKSIRILFCAFLLLGGITLQAAPVSQSRALDVAKRVFAAQPATKAAGDVKLIWNGEDIATKSAVQPAFYVFGRDGGGFVIVAGDDNVTPVLAISDRNEFKVEGMPENVKWWMDRMKAYVRATSSQTAEVRDQWSKFMETKAGASISGTVTGKVEHLTPEWGQGDIYHSGQVDQRQYFNSKCPKDTQGKYTITGCVATAISEVMTVLSGLPAYSTTMPTHGDGSVAPYEVGSGYVAASTDPLNPYTLGTVYDWEHLRTLTNWQAIEAAIAAGNGALVDNMDQLLADVGAVMRAEYSRGNTSAYTAKAPGYIAEYFGFNKAAYMDLASHYSRRQWEEKLKGQLVERPIIYNGRTEDDKYGHAFVFDGYGKYEGEDVFHVNFGWEGSCNGYYYETNLDSDGNPKYNYSWSCEAIFDFYPDPNPGSSTYPIKIGYSAVNANASGTTVAFRGIVSAQTFESGVTNKLYIGAIQNFGNAPYVGKFKLVREKRDGSSSDITTFQTFTAESPLEPDYRVWNWWNSFTQYDFEFGEHLVVYYSTDAEGTAWEKVSCPESGEFVGELALLPVNFIKTEATYHVGDWFAFRLMNNDKPYTGTKWTIVAPDGTTVGSNVPQSQREIKLTQAGTYKIQAAVAQSEGDPVVETVVTYITVTP